MADRSSGPRRLMRLILAAVALTFLLLAFLLAPSGWACSSPGHFFDRQQSLFWSAWKSLTSSAWWHSWLEQLAHAMLASHRDRAQLQLPARGLSLCLCSLMAIGLAELTAGLRRSWNNRADSVASTNKTFLSAFPNRSTREVTLAVLGESSRPSGTPFERWLSAGKIVAWQLEQAIPGQKVHVDSLAQAGDTLKGQYQKLAGLRRHPDALIVYCGHNELQSGFPWTRRVVHYLDDQPTILRRIDEFAGRVSPLCGLIRETADKFRSAVPPPPSLHNPLVDSPAYGAAEYAARLADFRRRLEAVASYCDRIGTLLILVVPPGNDAGFDPNRSFLPPQTPRAARGVRA